MLMIAIVDDDPRDSGALKNQVEHFLQKQKESYVVQVYQDGVDFIRSMEEFDIVFMDIRMEKLDGLESARVMRKISKETVLIFVTHMAQFAIKGYEVDAMDFIIKPADQFSIDHVLAKALKRVQDRTGVLFSLRTPNGLVKVYSNAIYYVEIYNHELIYHTQQGEYKLRGNLGEVAEKMKDQNFLLCSRSYLVNLRYVTSVHDDYLVVDGKEIPISKSHRKEIQQRFINYLGDSL